MRWSAGLVFVLVVSCAGTEKKRRLPLDLPERFSASGARRPAAKWWEAFGDEGLSRLVEEASGVNFGLRAAWARLDAARAVAAKAGAGVMPTATVTAGAGRSTQKVPPASRTYATAYNLGAGVSYEVDLWGGIRDAADAARLDAAASEYDLQAAAVTLSAQVVGVWLRLVAQKMRLRLIGKQMEVRRRRLSAVEERFRHGRTAAMDVLQERQALEALKGERELAAAEISVLEHQLAVLVGRAPGKTKFDVPDDLPALPPLPATGLPCGLVRRRPDLRALEARLCAADARVAAAVAERFPKLTLSANMEGSSGRVEDVLRNWFGSIAAGLLAPVFDAGRRRAEVARARAAAREVLNSYAEAVLNALREVEDALVRERRQAAYVASLEKQLTHAEAALEQALEAYASGAGDFLRCLGATAAVEQLQQQLTAARLQLLLYRVDLYRAMAGGWPLRRPHGTEEDSK